ncbi:MAG TPA: pyridoxal phosphate-dependent aminotransferase [Vicinamibacterales bacterium]|nr:pyridoxal phosphate-dependent aminotransferase [Vicinamibacterales bacterium]
MNFERLEYISWAKSMPRADINLARSGIDACPPSLLGLRAADLVTSLPVKYGYAPLLEAIGRRYRVASNRVLTLSGGTSFANYVAVAAALDGAPRGADVLVERPTYEPLWRIPRALGYRVKRFDRVFADAFAIDLERFANAITPRTRLAIVSNLHNPSGARIPMPTLRKMAAALARVGARLLVDEVYLECLFGARPQSCVHAGPNVVTTNSLTKAYGLDGLRAGWILGPAALIRRAGEINDYMTNNGVAPGEQLSLAAFRHHRAVDRRAHGILDRNLDRVRRYFEHEPRFRVYIPEGGNVMFPRLPASIDGDRFASRLITRYSTLVVPGRFFESPQHVRISFGCAPAKLDRGLMNLSRALDDLESRGV